jgi:hypothetical protein
MHLLELLEATRYGGFEELMRISRKRSAGLLEFTIQ